jgi:hypothetical protein
MRITKKRPRAIAAVSDDRPVRRWSHNPDGVDVDHVGPMAQDFYEAFGLGRDETKISSLDPSGVALAAIQALHAKTKEIDALRAQVAELQAQMKVLAGNQLKH